jgi:hypothetical protein
MFAGNFTKIQSWYIKFMAHKTKKESIVTKTLTKDEIIQLTSKQLELIDKYSQNEWGWWKTEWLWHEMLDGIDLIDENYSFMSNHPEYDSAKITFHVMKYKVEGKTVEFMSKSKLTQVHSKNGWEEKRIIK